MNWLGTLFSPITYFFSYYPQAVEQKFSADELTQKIQSLIRGLNETKSFLPATFDFKKSQAVLSAAVRLLDSESNTRKLSPFIIQLEQKWVLALDKTNKVFKELIFEEGIKSLEKVEDELMHCMDLLGSIIFMEMDNHENLVSRRCIFQYKKGEFYLQPCGRSAQYSTPDLKGYPATAKSGPEFLKMIFAQAEKIEQLDDHYIRDLFDQPDLNIPSEIEINLGDNFILLREQAALDLSRLNSLYVNGVPLLDIEKKIVLPSRSDKESDCKEIFLLLLQHLGGDAGLANNVTKLLTQASLARPVENVFFRFSNPDLGCYIQQDSFRSNHIWIEAESGRISIQLTMLVQLIKLSDLTGGKSVIAYSKISRCFSMPLQSLRTGTITNGSVTDYYSRFFSKREEAINK